MALSGIDGLLIQWGDRLFYPGNRRLTDAPARLRDPKRHADARLVRPDAARAWSEIERILLASGDGFDRELAGSIRRFLDLPSRWHTVAPMERGRSAVRDRGGPER